jgi:hypothetical protein
VPLPGLLLVQDDLRERLRTVARLSPAYDVLLPALGEEPLKAARRLRPELALLCLAPYKPMANLQLCRILKTDLGPIRAVGIWAPDGQPGADEVLRDYLADGYLGGSGDLLAFLDALARGERPRMEGAPSLGLRARLRRYLVRGAGR